VRDVASRGERSWRSKEVECCGRKGLLWELSREREREKKDVGDIMFGFSLFDAHVVVLLAA
jgi:hypothetical protein